MSGKTQVECKVLFSTANSVLITTDDEDEISLPLSQIEFLEGEPHQKGPATIELPFWLAKAKGLV